MTKAQLISSVSSRFTVVVNIVKVLLGIGDVINELYPTPVDDNSTDKIYTTKNTASITYVVKITKQGRSVRMNGTFTNTGLVSLPANTEILALKTNEFKGSTSQFLGINCIYTPFKLSSLTSIPAGANVNFSITYNSDL